ncbi:hypothetical protein Lsan_2171 [Legionella santicrucis]|uniref:Uncharacterized protein n=1 Tax=Legionella santicrucis TaxID=45074 RepID=A0A0W0YRQ1_9GAMM|nr:hypothetical protein [Legionella santicrucis]KTD59580.1 hypothetical protein Lsan_2171 [Legionella santicrucis]
MRFTHINIETLILVAIWEEPSIFQGCFKISTLQSKYEEYFFFRCELSNSMSIDFPVHEFYPDDYYFTHFYCKEEKLGLDNGSESIEYALYILKYALYITIKEMLSHRTQKHQFLYMDDIVLESLIQKIKPILNQNSLWSESMKEIGFAVAMDFCPQEEMAEIAVQTLLSHFSEFTA